MSKFRPPYPFLKWAGGKRRLAAQIVEQMPERCETYAEPFVGGGAIFFELAKADRFDRAILCDRNAELINLWRHVRDDVERVIELISQWPYDKDVFYEVRAMEPVDDLHCAARTLWLNRTCFNGLYRRNSKGKFNVPFGRYTNPLVVDRENLIECSRLLQGVELRDSDFGELLTEAQDGWVVYCDPPYWPVSETANFTTYDGFKFAAADQQRLADVFAELPARGAHGVLSNSSTPETRDLYARDELEVRTVMARRNINRNGDGRGPVEELLVATRGRSATGANG